MAAGKFIWYELMTSDPAAAVSFYTHVVGWDAKDSGMPGMDYTILATASGGVAGMMAIPEQARGAPPGWIGYIAVPDVDTGAAQLAGAGGTVHRGPADIPGVGRFAVVSDPQGAIFALFRGMGEPPAPPPAPDTPGYVGWHELQTTDREAGFAFYAEMFGWTKTEAMDMGAMGLYQMFATGERTVGGMMTRLPEVQRSFWLFYVNVAGIDAAVGRIAQGGGQVLHGPVQVPGGSWIVQARDPQGAYFALVGPKG